MRTLKTCSHITAAIVLVLLPATGAAGEFALKDGDRVVLLGNTLIEREQRYAYWEAVLSSDFPEQKVSFRNLGWSGDTVFGIARAGFGTQAEGFKHLQEHVEAIKPTVILVAYGTNESFDGEVGLPRFRQGLTALLDTLAKTDARIVLLSPPPMEKFGKSLPDPAQQNRNLQLYRDALKETASKRGLQFADLFDALGEGAKEKPAGPLTDNGMHLSAYGYWWSATALEQRLGLPGDKWRVELDLKDISLKTVGTFGKPSKSEIGFGITDARLPFAAPADAPGAATAKRVLVVRGLPADEKCTLRIDGKAVHTATGREWHDGVNLTKGPEFDQAEKLRTTIIAKNREYFHRWRPQNETYLFGFRKHEQGQNAVEIPKFDPIVADLEDEIAKLRVPKEHHYHFE